MTTGITIKRQFHMGTERGDRSPLISKVERASRDDRVPRISRLMAIAIRFDQLIRDGVVADQAELARLGNVTRARLTQILNLLQLAPDIQEKLLCTPLEFFGTTITERQLRSKTKIMAWKTQRISVEQLAIDTRATADPPHYRLATG